MPHQHLLLLEKPRRLDPFERFVRGFRVAVTFGFAVTAPQAQYLFFYTIGQLTLRVNEFLERCLLSIHPTSQFFLELIKGRSCEHIL